MGSLILLAFVVDYEGGKEGESEAKPIVGAFGVVGTSGCVESRGSPCDLSQGSRMSSTAFSHYGRQAQIFPPPLLNRWLDTSQGIASL